MFESYTFSQFSFLRPSTISGKAQILLRYGASGGKEAMLVLKNLEGEKGSFPTASNERGKMEDIERRLNELQLQLERWIMRSAYSLPDGDVLELYASIQVLIDVRQELVSMHAVSR